MICKNFWFEFVEFVEFIEVEVVDFCFELDGIKVKGENVFKLV